MEPEKLVGVAKDFAADYFEVIVGTLIRPQLRFKPGESSHPSSLILTSGIAEKTSTRLDGQLFVFMVMSMGISFVINSAFAEKAPEFEFQKAAAVIFVFWAVFSLLAAAACLLLRGQGSFWETVSVCFQVLASTSVLCSAAALFLHMLYVAIINHPGQRQDLGSDGMAFWFSGVVLYFVMHAFLFSVYFLWSMSLLHRFPIWKMAILCLVLIVGLYFKLSIYGVTVLIENHAVLE